MANPQLRDPSQPPPSSCELSVLRPALATTLVVEAGFHGIARRVHEVLNHTGNFIDAQGAGPGHIDEGGRAIVCTSKSLRVRSECARSG